MPRQRMIKPEFFDSESLSQCSIAARLAFIGLWVTSDDAGNQKAQLHRLRHQIFPYDDLTEIGFLSLLCELESVGCVKGYEIDGERYITVPNFAIYQTVNRPSKSSIPEPPKEVEKSKRTTAINEWMSALRELTEHSVTHTQLSESSVSTHAKERKKEGRKEVLRDIPPIAPQRASEVEEVVGYLNSVLGTSYRPSSKETSKHINARLDEGFSVADFKAVIDDRASRWKHDQKMQEYLRPRTLFAPSKFEGYLQSAKQRGVRANAFSEYD